MSNSDAALLAFFVDFLREEFAVANDRIAVSCNLFADHVADREGVEAFWLGALGLQRSSLRKSIVNNYSRYSLKKRRNRLPYGTCKIAVHSTQIVHTIYGSIQQLGGFDREEWLDLR
jgi:hypothetical protein